MFVSLTIDPNIGANISPIKLEIGAEELNYGQEGVGLPDSLCVPFGGKNDNESDHKFIQFESEVFQETAEYPINIITRTVEKPGIVYSSKMISESTKKRLIQTIKRSVDGTLKRSPIIETVCNPIIENVKRPISKTTAKKQKMEITKKLADETVKNPISESLKKSISDKIKGRMIEIIKRPIDDATNRSATIQTNKKVNETIMKPIIKSTRNPMKRQITEVPEHNIGEEITGNKWLKRSIDAIDRRTKESETVIEVLQKRIKFLEEKAVSPRVGILFYFNYKPSLFHSLLSPSF